MWIVSGFVLGLVIVAFTLAMDTIWEIEYLQPTLEGSAVVEVQNGSGIRRAGERVSNFLSQKGFDVLFVGNADDFDYSETIVIDCIGDISKARGVASLLNCNNVIRQVEVSPLVEVRVIVGKDIAELGLSEDIGRPSVGL